MDVSSVFCYDRETMDERGNRELQKLLQKNIKITQDNNRLLRSMHRAMQWGRFVRIIYWVIIIGSALGVYYYVEPIIGNLRGGVDSAFSGLEKLQEIGTLFDNKGE